MLGSIVTGIGLMISILILIALRKIDIRRPLRATNRVNPDAYYSVKPLSKTEQAFYKALKANLPGHIILAQVDLKQVIKTKRGASKADHSRMAQLSLDYLICRQDFSIVAAIELDDPSHDTPVRQARDEKKNAILRAANIDLIRWDVRNAPTSADIRHRVQLANG